MNRSLLTIALLTCCAVSPALAQRAAAPAGTNPFARDAKAAQQGGDIFSQNCSQCHGPYGGGGQIGPALVNGEGQDPAGGDAQMFDFTKNGIAGTVMAAFSGKLSDDDIWKVITYIHAQRGFAIDSPTPGDVAHGEQVFWGKGQCGTCHVIGTRGGAAGPDLSNVAGTRKTQSIIDALTKPLHHIYEPGGSHMNALPPLNTYLPVRVTTANGKVVSGVLMNQDNFSLQILGDDQQLHLFDRAALRNIAIGAKSAMPTDYDKRLAPDEFKDLLAFLTRQGKATPPAR